MQNTSYFVGCNQQNRDFVRKKGRNCKSLVYNNGERCPMHTIEDEVIRFAVSAGVPPPL